VELDPQGIPRVSPDSAEGVALVCRLAHEEGLTIRLEGRGTWLQPDAEADFVLSTSALDQITDISPADLVVTVQAGTPFETLQRRAADHGMWLALDPPGRPDRSIGSIVATATAGPLQSGLGPVRDHVLGVTVVAGDGRVLTSGGQVVKNVAGYDLTKLHVGGFGGFGVITEMHLRLRAQPNVDTTLTACGTRDALTFAARTLIETGARYSALELLSPAVAAQAEWTLAARLLGTESSVRSSARQIHDNTDLTWHELPADESSALWGLVSRAWLGGPVTIRLGALVDGLDDTIDLLAALLDEELVAAGAAMGGIRWAGSATPDQLLTLRHRAGEREIPVTLERAPWVVRHHIGHFGAYREGVGDVVQRLRETFDHHHCFRVALDEAEDA
jgi:FAD/FMN-containing dehydrogenase